MTIEEKIKKVSTLVRKKLDDSNILYNYVGTGYEERGLLKDSSRKEIFSTTIIDPLFRKIIHICSDVETLEIIQIQTGPTNFADINLFFEKRELNK